LGGVENPAKHRPKFKSTEGDPPVLLPQDETDGISPTFIVSVLDDERIRNIEEHLSVRYGTGLTPASIKNQDKR
jgi:hypothetical protein